MIKTRVYEVAREMGLDNRELMTKLATLGIQVRNHMSSLEPIDIERVKRSLDKDKQQNVVEERIRPTVVRRRSVKRDDEEEVVEAAGRASVPSMAPVTPQTSPARERDRDEPRRAPSPPARTSAPASAASVAAAP